MFCECLLNDDDMFDEREVEKEKNKEKKKIYKLHLTVLVTLWITSLSLIELSDKKTSFKSNKNNETTLIKSSTLSS